MTEQQINLGQIVGKDHKYELSVSNESPEDAASRRTKEASDEALKRRMTFVLFLFALAVTGVVFAESTEPLQPIHVEPAGAGQTGRDACSVLSRPRP